jgi:quercetin dioxygenase-like cupin family protein
MCIVGAIVEFPPGAGTPPHNHGTAFVRVLVLEGALISAMNNEPPKAYAVGDSLFENPGCRHRVSDNGSTTEKCRIFVTFIVEEGYKSLMNVEEEFLD